MSQYLSSTTLRKNVLKSKGIDSQLIDPYTYQAHHIIPGDVVKHFIETNYPTADKEVFNEAWNAIMLPSNKTFLTLLHLGSHERYSGFIISILGAFNCTTYISFVTLCQKFVNILNTKFNMLDYGSSMILDQFTEIFLEPAANEIIRALQ